MKEQHIPHHRWLTKCIEREDSSKRNPPRESLGRKNSRDVLPSLMIKRHFTALFEMPLRLTEGEKKNEEILEEFFFWWISFVFIPLGNVSVVGLRRSTGTHRHSLKAEKWVTQKKGPVYAAMNNPKRPLVNPRFFCATWWSVSQIFPLSTLSLSIFPTRSLPFLSRSFVLDWSDPAANARAARESPWLATSHIAQIKKKSRKKKEIRTRPSRVLSMSWKLGTTQ